MADSQRLFGAQRGTPSPIQAIANLAEARLKRPGFRYFQNGGTPLLERRRDDWLEEIVIRPEHTAEGGGIRITLHLGNSALRDMRARYWEPVSRAPILITSGDCGELDLPPRVRVWPIPTTPEETDAIVTELEETILPWFRRFRDDDLVDQLTESVIPLVDSATALELVLLVGSTRAARKYIHRQGLDSPRLWKELETLNFSRYTPTERLGEMVRIAKIIASYRLLD